MIITKQVQQIIQRFPTDYVFTYQDLNLPSEYIASAIKMLNRLAKEGAISKIAKGKFYKPKQSVFGPLKPKQEEIVKDLLENEGKVIGYLTGYSVFNRWGLTTQIPNIIQIGTNARRNKKKRGIYEIGFILQPNKITRNNLHLLQLLDTIKLIKEIPDSTTSLSCQRIISILKDKDKKEIDKMIILGLKYPPMTRALLGAMIEGIFGEEKTTTLQKSLNPLTTYKIGIDPTILPESKKWNIQ